MGMSEHDLSNLEKRVTAEKEEAIAGALKEGASTEARRIAGALEMIKALTRPLRESAVKAYIAIDPDHQGDQRSIQYRDVGDSLMSAADQIQNHGIDPIIRIRHGEMPTDNIPGVLATVYGDEPVRAVVQALTNGTTRSLNIKFGEKDRKLHFTKVNRKESGSAKETNVYVVQIIPEPGTRSAASIVVARPGHFESQVAQSH